MSARGAKEKKLSTRFLLFMSYFDVKKIIVQAIAPPPPKGGGKILMPKKIFLTPFPPPKNNDMSLMFHILLCRSTMEWCWEHFLKKLKYQYL